MPFMFNPCQPCCGRVWARVYFCRSQTTAAATVSPSGTKIEIYNIGKTNLIATVFTNPEGMIVVDGLAATTMYTIVVTSIFFPVVEFNQSFVITQTAPVLSSSSIDSGVPNKINVLTPSTHICCYQTCPISKSKKLHAVVKYPQDSGCFFPSDAELFTVEADLDFYPTFLVSQSRGISYQNCWAGKSDNLFKWHRSSTNCLGGSSPYDTSIENIKYTWIVYTCSANTFGNAQVFIFANSTGTVGTNGILDGDPVRFMNPPYNGGSPGNWFVNSSGVPSSPFSISNFNYMSSCGPYLVAATFHISRFATNVNGSGTVRWDADASYSISEAA